MTLWTVVSLICLYCLLSVLRWAGDYFVITDQRLLVVSGVLRKNVAVAPLNSVADMRLVRPLAGRLFGYGTFLNAPGKRPEVIREFVPYPEEVYLELCAKLFPSSADDDDHDGDDDEGRHVKSSDEL